MSTFEVRYQAGPYEGVRTVNAEDEDQAIARVRKWVRAATGLPMFAESYRVVRAVEVVEGGGE